MRTVRKRPAEVLLGLLMLGSAALLLHYRSGLGFMIDDWDFVINRADGNLGDYLNPHNEHISILPVAAYKLLLSVFGMGSPVPFHVLAVLVFLLSVFALFTYMRPLTGDAAALVGCAVVLFLGAAWEDLLWAFQLGFFASMASGIGALVMLRREDRIGDRLACLFLSISIISSSLGIPFLLGAAVDLLVRRDRRLERMWLVVVPFLIYAAWWLGWGHEASNAISAHNAVNSPIYVFNAFSYAVGVLTGTFRLSGGDGNNLVRILGIALIVLTCVLLWRQRRLPRALLVALAVAIGFWGLASLNVVPGRDFFTSRYQYPSAIFLLMILAGAVDGRKIRVEWVLALTAVASIAIVVNLFVLGNGYHQVFKPTSDKDTANLTALDIAGPNRPETKVGMDGTNTFLVDSTAYFAAEDRYGSASWSTDELQGKTETAREQVDRVLISALPVKNVPVKGASGQSNCRSQPVSITNPQSIEAPGRSFTVRPQEDVFVLLARFGDSLVSGSGLAQAGKTTRIVIPPDESDVPWRVGFAGEGGRVRVCSA